MRVISETSRSYSEIIERHPDAAVIVPGSVRKVQHTPLNRNGHGMRVMSQITGSFGEDAHHDRQQS